MSQIPGAIEGRLLCIDDGEQRWYQAVYLIPEAAERAKRELEEQLPGIMVEVLPILFYPPLEPANGKRLVRADRPDVPLDWEGLSMLGLTEEDWQLAEEGNNIFEWLYARWRDGQLILREVGEGGGATDVND